MGKVFDKFDPDNITKESMKFLGEKFEEFIDELTAVMIIPDELSEKCHKEIKEGFKRSNELIKKLKKGDSSVFKDSDEWNSVI